MCNFTGHVWRPAKQRENSSRAHAVHNRTLSHFGINDRTEGKNNVSFNNHRLITTYISEVMTSTNCIAFDILSALEAVFHPMNIRRTWLEYSSFFMRHERFMCVCVCAHTLFLRGYRGQTSCTCQEIKWSICPKAVTSHHDPKHLCGQFTFPSYQLEVTACKLCLKVCFLLKVSSGPKLFLNKTSNNLCFSPTIVKKIFFFLPVLVVCPIQKQGLFMKSNCIHNDRHVLLTWFLNYLRAR